MTNEPFMLVSLKGDKAKKLAQVMSNPTCTKILEHLAGKDATETKIAEDLKVPLSTVHYNLQQLVAAKLVVVDEFHYSEKGREINHYKLAKKYIIIAPEDDDPTFLEKLKKFIPVTILTLGLAAILKTMQFFTRTLPTESFASPAAYNAPFAAPVVDDAVDSIARSAAESIGGAQIATNTASGAMDSAPAAKMMMVSINETVNETFNESGIVNNTVQAIPVDHAAQPVLDEAARQEMAMRAINGPMSGAAQQTVQSAHWWQSPLIDYFIAGAIFVLLVLVITEMINHLRAKSMKR